MGFIDEGNGRVLALLNKDLNSALVLWKDDTIEEFGSFP